ncbi:ABA4-like family protein [Saccharothrix sp. BKS2]|uniref:ABA4-like family protein n=1 Tax=Saccharothrix sp. BKS2 TaxID=3064400 RepID=UPI0039EA9890
MTGFLFQLTFWLTAPFWALMIFAPAWSWTARIVSSPLIAVPPVAIYAVLVAGHMPELLTAVSSPELGSMRELAASAWGTSAFWAHVIAWDLLVGAWMYREGRRLGVHPLLMGPLLVATILVAPLGFAVFLVVRRLCDTPDRATSVVTHE